MRFIILALSAVAIFFASGSLQAQSVPTPSETGYKVVLQPGWPGYRPPATGLNSSNNYFSSAKNLREALARAEPGDLFLIGGLIDLGSTPLIIKRSGTPERPIVLRGILGSGIFQGSSRIDIRANNIIIEGLTFSKTPHGTLRLRGRNIIVRNNNFLSCGENGAITSTSACIYVGGNTGNVGEPIAMRNIVIALNYFAGSLGRSLAVLEPPPHSTTRFFYMKQGEIAYNTFSFANNIPTDPITNKPLNDGTTIVLGEAYAVPEVDLENPYDVMENIVYGNQIDFQTGKELISINSSGNVVERNTLYGGAQSMINIRFGHDNRIAYNYVSSSQFYTPTIIPSITVGGLRNSVEGNEVTANWSSDSIAIRINMAAQDANGNFVYPKPLGNLIRKNTFYNFTVGINVQSNSAIYDYAYVPIGNQLIDNVWAGSSLPRRKPFVTNIPNDYAAAMFFADNPTNPKP